MLEEEVGANGRLREGKGLSTGGTEMRERRVVPGEGSMAKGWVTECCEQICKGRCAANGHQLAWVVS